MNRKINRKIWKIVSNKTKDLVIENELKILKTFDESGTQNYYIFQPISKYLKAADANDINYIL